MKKTSKLLALVMALVLALGSFTTAMAEESNGFSMSDLTKGALDDIAENVWAYYATEFYKELMATTTQEEFENVQATHPLVGDKLYSSMTDEQRADLFAHNVDLSAVNGEAIAYSTDGVAVNAPAGAFPTGTEANVAAVTDENVLAVLAEAIAAVDETAAIIDAYDINFNYTVMGVTDEVQPYTDTTVPLTFTVADADLSEDCTGLAVYHMVEDGNGGYVAELVGESELGEGETQSVTVEGSAFSIYVVTGGTGENHYNYKILMSVGDTLELTSTNASNNRQWSIASGDTSSFSLSDNQGTTTEITARSAGTVTVGYGTNETITVTALPAVGSTYRDDIIFANIRLDIDANNDEYTNTYGPYVMKIRFEDTEGNLLDMGEDHYVFDSACNIDVNTFAASAPSGMTYAGSFFYWTSHNDFDGAKVYVTSVNRKNALAYGSYLWYSGTHDSSGQGSWAYQASGVLHVVYAPVDDVHTITFKDHCGYELANYALNHNDSDGGIKFPSGYVDNIDNMANTLIPNHHNSHDAGYTFDGSWVVTGGGDGIDGTYKTARLTSVITGWNIKSNIVVTAVCTEPEVTINYIPVTGTIVNDTTGGTVSPTSETVKVASETASGSTATANTNYKFVGWYKEESCATLLSTEAKYVPEKVNGKNVAATYYAKFELDVSTLTISKSVVKQDATNTADAPNNDAFEFTVTLPNGTYNYTLTKADKTTETKTLTVAEDSGTLELKAGETAVISGIVIGSSYTVTETTKADYTSTSTNANGTIDADGETVSFTNTYTKLKTSTLTISKTVNKQDATNTADAPSGDAFTFTVTLPNGTYNYTLTKADKTTETKTLTVAEDSGTLELKAGETAVISGIDVTSEYTVVESPKADYTQASATGANGTIDVDGETAAFVNTYTKLKTNSLIISKTVETIGGVADTNNPSFDFEVELKDAAGTALTGTYKYTIGAVEKEITLNAGKDTIQLKAGESAVFEAIPVTTQYSVKEDTSKLPTGYALKTGVSQTQSGTINVTAQSTASFTNTYTTTSVEVSKTVVGKDAPKTTDEFDFTLTLTESNLTSVTYTKGANAETKYTLPLTNGVGTFKLKDGEYVTFIGIPVGAGYKVEEASKTNYVTTIDEEEVSFAEGTLTAEKVTVDFTNTYQLASLTITKDGLNAFIYPEGDHESAIFTVKAADGYEDMDSREWTVAINGDGSVTIKGVKVGVKYTVTEANDWTWRYNDAASQDSEEITVDGYTVEFKNSLAPNGKQWLGGDNYKVNIFGKPAAPNN